MSSMPAIQLPAVFRLRLTVAFVVVAGLAAGSLSLGSFVVASDQRHRVFVDRSREQSRTVLALTRGEASADRLESVVALARGRNGFETLVDAEGVVSSRPGLGLDQIPIDVRTAEEGRIATATTHIDGEPFLVAGGPVPGSGERAHLYLLFSEVDLRASLDQLRTVLVAGWIAVTVLAALAGRVIARRTLAPIQQAADAARSLTEGLLDTRLPDTGSDEFGAWARYFNEMAAALEHKIQELERAHIRERRFTADVAHDLRTPLGAMVSASSLLSDSLSEMPPTARRPAELLIGDVGRLRRLVSDLLELGRLDAEQEPPVPEPIDLQVYFESVVRSAAGATPVSVNVPDVRIMSDRLRLERVLFNLINNAAVHGRDSVEATAVVDGNLLVVDVSDRGPGIPEEELPFVFERFHKASASRSSEGSGLGLAIAYQHARFLGGSLKAENREGGGARFTFKLPLEPQH